VKLLANCVQYLIIAIIIYPVYYIWETDKVTHFCELVENGMSKKQMVRLGEASNVNMKGPDDVDLSAGKWQAYVVPGMLVTAEKCVINGSGDKVASAKLLEIETPS
jgi:hypothetical protein